MTTQTTRRAALVGAAALPAMSLPAMAAPDPVFEKAANYRAAWYSVRGHTKEPVDASGGIARKSPEYKVWQDKERKLWGLLEEAEDDLISTEPRTLAGAADQVRAYLEVSSHDVGDDVPMPLLENLLAYLKGAHA